MRHLVTRTRIHDDADGAVLPERGFGGHSEAVREAGDPSLLLVLLREGPRGGRRSCRSCSGGGLLGQREGLRQRHLRVTRSGAGLGGGGSLGSLSRNISYQNGSLMMAVPLSLSRAHLVASGC